MNTGREEAERIAEGYINNGGVSMEEKGSEGREERKDKVKESSDMNGMKK